MKTPEAPTVKVVATVKKHPYAVIGLIGAAVFLAWYFLFRNSGSASLSSPSTNVQAVPTLTSTQTPTLSNPFNNSLPTEQSSGATSAKIGTGLSSVYNSGYINNTPYLSNVGNTSTSNVSNNYTSNVSNNTQISNVYNNQKTITNTKTIAPVYKAAPLGGIDFGKVTSGLFNFIGGTSSKAVSNVSSSVSAVIGGIKLPSWF